MISALEALKRLKDGNARFVSENDQRESKVSKTRPQDLMHAQNPFAIILGCSDSRVPAEIIFDQGLGDLFVIRVAGNIVAPSLVGSIEFAAEQFGTRLVVVLGHTMCGAVQATLAELERSEEMRSPNLRAIVNFIKPSVEKLIDEKAQKEKDQLLDLAVRSNILTSANHLREKSPILKQLIQNDGLVIVGAEYSLQTGVVDFFDGAPN